MKLKLLSNILYILATGFLLAASIITFENKLPSYLYLIGTSLFFIKSIITLIEYINKKNNKYELYSGIL